MWTEKLSKALLPGLLGALIILSPLMTEAVMAQTPSPAPAPTPTPRPVPLAPVSLSASPSQPSYLLGERVVIHWTLTNGGGIALGLSPVPDGNLRILSFTRDGQPVSPVASIVTYDAGLPAMLEGGLTAVSAGGTLSSTWSSDLNGELGGEILSAVQPRSDLRGQAAFYPLTTPGTYSVTLTYQYAGSLTTYPGAVFTGQTNRVTVTFQVQ